MNHPNKSIAPGARALLLVEGGDELQLCKHILGPNDWTRIHCWKSSGRADMATQAQLAALDANIGSVHQVGVVMDMESSLAETVSILNDIGTALAQTDRVVSAFVMPDGVNFGSTESLCLQAVRNKKMAACTGAFQQCCGPNQSTQARRDKGWLKAYLSMLEDPTLRFDQAFDDSDGIDLGAPTFDALRSFLINLCT